MQIILTRTGPQSFGVTFGRNSNGLVVTHVTHLGIAHLADLRVGDIILRVNNQSCYAIAVAAMEALMSSNTHIILEISRTSATNSNQTPQSAISNRLSLPSGSQVIELDSEDDDDEDEDEDDERTLQFGFNDASYSDEYSDEDEEDRMFEQRRQNILDAQRTQALRAQHMRAAAPVAPPRPVVPYRPGEVVDLLSDDDEPPRAAAPVATGRPPTAPASARPGVPAPLARSATQPLATPASTSVGPGSAARSQTAAILARAASTPASTVQPRITGAKRIIETPSPDAATTVEPAKRRKITINGVEIKLEFEPKKFGEANVTDEVVEVLGEDDEPAAEVEMVTSSSATASATKPVASNDAESDFEDFQIVGGTMQVASDMPHQRYACTMHPYRVAPAEVQTHQGMRNNESAAAYAERCRMNIKHCP